MSKIRTLGEQIRRTRIEKGLTQNYLNIIEHTFTAINHLHCFDIFRQVSVLSDVDFRRNMAKKILKNLLFEFEFGC